MWGPESCAYLHLLVSLCTGCAGANATASRRPFHCSLWTLVALGRAISLVRDMAHTSPCCVCIEWCAMPIQIMHSRVVQVPPKMFRPSPSMSRSSSTALDYSSRANSLMFGLESTDFSGDSLMPDRPPIDSRLKSAQSSDEYSVPDSGQSRLLVSTLHEHGSSSLLPSPTIVSPHAVMPFPEEDQEGVVSQVDIGSRGRARSGVARGTGERLRF